MTYEWGGGCLHIVTVFVDCGSTRRYSKLVVKSTNQSLVIYVNHDIMCLTETNMPPRELKALRREETNLPG
jgi:hypothetical protein